MADILDPISLHYSFPSFMDGKIENLYFLKNKTIYVNLFLNDIQ